MPIERTIERIVSKIKKTYDVDISDIERVFLKAIPLHDLDDLRLIRDEVRSGNIMVVNVSPFAGKNIDKMKQVIIELSEFAESVGGDIARLGKERVVITPAFIWIWRGKSLSGKIGSNPV